MMNFENRERTQTLMSFRTKTDNYVTVQTVHLFWVLKRLTLLFEKVERGAILQLSEKIL